MDVVPVWTVIPIPLLFDGGSVMGRGKWGWGKGGGDGWLVGGATGRSAGRLVGWLACCLIS